VNAAGLGSRIDLVRGDAESLPLPDGFCSVVCADLLWGEALGDSKSNAILYQRFFLEAHCVSRPDSSLIVLTFDKAAMETIEPRINKLFRKQEVRSFLQRGFQSECTLYSCVK
jgi:23S rRNA G2445 N2-methylase RlmL